MVDANTLFIGGIVLATLGGLAIGVGFYLLPSFIAKHRQIELRGRLYLINVVFGWSGLGWLACLIWALLGDRESGRGIDRFERREPQL